MQYKNRHTLRLAFSPAVCYRNYMDILTELKASSDASYRQFSAKLIPNIDPSSILGCRQPYVRDLAKRLTEAEARAHLAALPHRYTEENTLHGLLIGRLYPKDIAGALEKTEEFLPYIDNWAVCDTTVTALKAFARFPQETLTRVYAWLQSDRTYTVRFAAVTLMNYFLDKNFDKASAEKLCAVRGGEYYIDMAIAWYFATALAKQYESVIDIFTGRKLPVWTHNKAIQKAKESFRVPEERKIYLNTLKY